MRIFFTCTTLKFNKYKNLYFEIHDFLIKEGHVLTRDWLTNLRNNSKNFEDSQNGSEGIYHETVNAVCLAKALIVENTVESLSNGHLITIALQRRIPVLVLYQNTEEKYFSKTLLNGLKDEFLTIKEYEHNQYQSIIQKFLKKSDLLREKHHFHLVLNGEQKSYLDWIKFNTTLSQTDLIKEAIDERLGNDINYQNYRSGILDKTT